MNGPVIVVLFAGVLLIVLGGLAYLCDWLLARYPDLFDEEG